MIGVIAVVDFGGRLKALRTDCGLSQEQLAIRLGITKGMISSYETSMRMPSYAILIKIARVFSVSTDYLLGLDDVDAVNLAGLTSKQKAIILDTVNEFRNMQ
jgi:transcriptional regulator with XRE-family HTH domain